MSLIEVKGLTRCEQISTKIPVDNRERQSRIDCEMQDYKLDNDVGYFYALNGGKINLSKMLVSELIRSNALQHG